MDAIKCSLLISVSNFLQIGSLFTEPHSSQAGAGPSVGDVIGLALVEHVILWRSVKAPRRRLALLIVCFSFLFVVGTLPHVNNFSLIAGLLHGFIFALIVQTPVVLRRRVALLRLLFVFVYVKMFLLCVILFYGVQHLGVRSVFRFINCIPYVKGLCDQEVKV